MDDAERKVLKRRLVRMLRAIYLTSVTAANVCASHARHAHAGERAARLQVHVAELRERREAAAELLAAMGRGRPWLRAIIHPMTRLWGRLSALTGGSFSLHMLGNMEAQGEKLTSYAAKLARELEDAAAIQMLARLAQAEGARKAFIVAELERLSG